MGCTVSARRLLLQQDAPDLRSVTVGDDDLPPHGRDVGDTLRGLAACPVHLFERVVGAPAQQGIAAQRDHDPLRRDISSGSHPPQPRTVSNTPDVSVPNGSAKWWTPIVHEPWRASCRSRARDTAPAAGSSS